VSSCHPDFKQVNKNSVEKWIGKTIVFSDFVGSIFKIKVYFENFRRNHKFMKVGRQHIKTSAKLAVDSDSAQFLDLMAENILII
jgi:hypothetical protein